MKQKETSHEQQPAAEPPAPAMNDLASLAIQLWCSGSFDLENWAWESDAEQEKFAALVNTHGPRIEAFVESGALETAVAAGLGMYLAQHK